MCVLLLGRLNPLSSGLDVAEDEGTLDMGASDVTHGRVTHVESSFLMFIIYPNAQKPGGRELLKPSISRPIWHSIKRSKGSIFSWSLIECPGT